MVFLAQIIGFFAVATFLMSYQMKKRKSIILVNVVSRFLYILQYLFLGALSGAALDVLGAAASVIAGKKDAKALKKHKALVITAVTGVMVVVGLSIAYINKSFLDLFSLTGVLLHTGAFWINDEKIIRRISFLGSPFWFVYNFFSKAYGSAIGDLLTMCSIVIAMLRHGEGKGSAKER